MARKSRSRPQKAKKHRLGTDPGKSDLETQGPQRYPTQSVAVLLLAVLAVSMPILFSPGTTDSFFLPKQTLMMLIVILAAATLIGGTVMGFKLRRGHKALDLAVMILALVSVLSTVASINPGFSLIGKVARPEGLLATVGYVGLYFVVSRIDWTSSRLRTLLWSIIGGAVVVSAYAFIQAAGSDPVDWLQRGFAADRFGASFGNPIYLAVYLSIVTMAIAYLVLTSKEMVLRIVAGISALPVVGALWLTQGRAGYLGLLAGAAAVVIMIIIDRRRSEQGATGLNAGVGVAAAVAVGLAGLGIGLAEAVKTANPLPPSPVTAELTDSARLGSVSDRIGIWQSTLPLIAARPLVGHGPDSFQIVFPKYQNLFSAQLESAEGFEGRRAEDAHNYVLQLTSTTGLVGVAALFFLIIVGMWTLVAPGSKENWERRYLYGGIVVVFLSTALVTPVVNGTAFLFWITLGLISAHAAVQRPAEAEVDRKAPGGAAFISVMLLAPGAGILLFMSVLPQFAEIRYSAAERAWAAGDSSTALEAYDSAVRLNPYRDRYLGQKGLKMFDLALFNANNLEVDAALATVAEAWDKNPREQSYPLAIGRMNMRLDGAYPVTSQRALALFDEAIGLAPNDPRAHYWRARAILASDDSDTASSEAIDSLNQALTIAPEYAEAIELLSELEEDGSG